MREERHHVDNLSGLHRLLHLRHRRQIHADALRDVRVVAVVAQREHLVLLQARQRRGGLRGRDAVEGEEVLRGLRGRGGESVKERGLRLGGDGAEEVCVGRGSGREA